MILEIRYYDDELGVKKDIIEDVFEWYVDEFGARLIVIALNSGEQVIYNIDKMIKMETE